MRINMALEFGSRTVSTDVMRRYQVAVVSHGSPEREEIEAFRQQFVRDWDTVQKPQLEKGVESRERKTHARRHLLPLLIKS